MNSGIIIRAPAKINLGLAVLGRRPDGYHELVSMMQQVSLSDFLVLGPGEKQGLDFRCSDPALAGENNLVCRAAALLEQEAGRGKLPGVKITLYKNIPVEAGLAGGSSDAAAALAALNDFWRLGLTVEELMELGGRLGSDIPFCLHGGTALATGRGELLQPLPSLPFHWVVLASPAGLRLSTVAVYRVLDQSRSVPPPLERLVEAVEQGSRKAIRDWFAGRRVNSLEAAVAPRYPAISRLKERFESLGLLPAMSGSGPSIFALTGELAAARAAARALQEEGNRTFLSWTI